MFTNSYGRGQFCCFGCGCVNVFVIWRAGMCWGPVPVQTSVHVEAIPTLLFETGSVTGLEFTK